MSKETDLIERAKIKKAVGERIQHYREKAGYTQDTLAEKVDVTPNYLSAVERGVSFPRPEKLVAIINAIGATADQIFCDYIFKSYTTRACMLSDDLSTLPFEEQGRIFAVVETMIQQAKTIQEANSNEKAE